MILSEAIRRVQIALGFRSDLQADIILELGYAQKELERGPSMPWFLLSEDSMIRTSIGEHRIPLPGDFLGEYEDGALYYQPEDEDGDRIYLQKEDKDLLDSNLQLETSTPYYYSIDGGYFNIFPYPDDLYQIHMHYYKADSDISGLALSSTNKWLTSAPDLLIGKAGHLLAVGARDPFAAAKFEEMMGRGAAILENENERRKHENRRYQMGGPH